MTAPILNEPFEAYQTSGHFGSGALRDFIASALLFKARHLDATEPRPDSAAFAYGRYFHALALEGPEVAATRYTVLTERFDRRTNAGKAAWAARQAEGKPIIDGDDAALAHQMAAGLFVKQTWRTLTGAGAPEAVFRTKLHGVPVQCRADWWNPAHADLDRYHRPLVLDVKTVESLADFPRHFDRYGYWLQAGFYQLVVTEALKLTGYYPRFVFAVVEKSAPHDCAFYEIEEATADLARTRILAAIERLNDALSNSNFVGEPDEIQTVSLPEYKLNQGTDK